MQLKSQTNIADLVIKNLERDSPELLQEALDIQSELERREEGSKAKYYIPNGKTAEFIKMVGEDERFINMFVAANSVGKSAAGANVIANICYGVQSEWFNYPLFQKFPYIKKGRIISDPTTIKEKIVPELQKWFPANEASKIPLANYETSKEGKNYIAKFITNSGFEIDIMSNEQDTKEYESVDLGFVWIDEPMPKDKFMATIARGRMGMIIFWTFTPLSYSAWIKDWMDDHSDGKYADYVEAELEDNCKMHGVRGILEHANIKRMVAAFPPDEMEARAFGKFGHLIGRVHKLFKRKVHVIKPFPVEEKRFTTYMALDPHPRVPDHALWLAVDKNGTKYVCAELISPGTSKELAQRIKATETAMHFRMRDRIIDPSAYIDDQHHEQASVGSRLEELGLRFIKGSKDIMAGIKRTDDALRYEIKEGEMVVAPEIYFFDTCPVTIKQMEEYVWNDYRGSRADEKQPMGKPKDRNDHQPENLHRLLLHEPQFYPYDQRSGIPFDDSDNFDPY